MQRTLDALWSNWMFRLSLSSHELFHSNTIQYLSQLAAGEGGVRVPAHKLGEQGALQSLRLFSSDPALADQIRRVMGSGPFGVRREAAHTDLQVVTGTRPLFVVELKVKAYPTAKQLVGYGIKASQQWQPGDRFVPPVFLLSLVGGAQACAAAGEERGDLRFKAVSFGELAARINLLDVPAQAKPFQSEYVALCQLLDALATQMAGHINDGLTLGQAGMISRVLAPYRMDAIWNKLWQSHLYHRLEVSLPHPIQKDTGYTDTGLVEAYYSAVPKPSDTGRSLKVGVQLQGDSLRLFLSLKDPRVARRGRWAAERALLMACRRDGLFADNPRYKDYVAFWRREADWWNDDIHMPVVDGGTAAGNQWPETQGKRQPRLQGYITRGGGFADFRRKLPPTITVGDVVDLFRNVLLQNQWSRVEAGDDSVPQAVCQRYQEDPDGWLSAHSLLEG